MNYSSFDLGCHVNGIALTNEINARPRQGCLNDLIGVSF